MNYGDTRLPERFWAKVSPEPNSGCWLWTASLLSTGYAQYRPTEARSSGRAHRVAYEALVGPIPAGHDIDHLCRTRCCVNPAHLEPVTRAENMRRSPLGRSNPEVQRRNALGRRKKSRESEAELHRKVWETRRARYGTSGRKP